MPSSDRIAALMEKLSKCNPFTGTESLPEPPRPDEKTILPHLSIVEQLALIQKQLDVLSYNHLPQTFFCLDKHRTLQSILITAKEALAEALPIRCLEATFVGLYLTQELKNLQRFPLSFKSQINGHYHRHIVLVVHARSPTALYGALGLSRKPTLMYKPLQYASLFDLLMDYKMHYEKLGHTLIDIKLGLAVTHDSYSRIVPCWRFVAIKMNASHPESHSGALAKETPTDSSASATKSAEGSSGGSPTEQPRRKPVTVSLDEPIAVEGVPPSVGAEEHEPDGKTDGAIPPLAAFLDKYCRLLATMSDHYYKRLPAAMESADGNERLCFVDLDNANSSAANENQRRVGWISAQRSPLCLEARQLACQRAAALSPRCTSRKRTRSTKRPAAAAAVEGTPARAGKTLTPQNKAGVCVTRSNSCSHGSLSQTLAKSASSVFTGATPRLVPARSREPISEAVSPVAKGIASVAPRISLASPRELPS